MGTTDFNTALEEERDYYTKKGKFSENFESLVKEITKHPLHETYFGDIVSCKRLVKKAIMTGDDEVLLLVFNQMVRQGKGKKRKKPKKRVPSAKQK